MPVTNQAYWSVGSAVVDLRTMVQTNLISVITGGITTFNIVTTDVDGFRAIQLEIGYGTDESSFVNYVIMTLPSGETLPARVISDSAGFMGVLTQDQHPTATPPVTLDDIEAFWVFIWMTAIVTIYEDFAGADVDDPVIIEANPVVGVVRQEMASIAVKTASESIFSTETLVMGTYDPTGDGSFETGNASYAGMGATPMTVLGLAPIVQPLSDIAAQEESLSINHGGTVINQTAKLNTGS